MVDIEFDRHRRNRRKYLKARARSAGRRRADANMFLTIVLCLLSLSALTGCLVLVLQNQSLRQETAQMRAGLTEQNMLAENLEAAVPVTAIPANGVDVVTEQSEIIYTEPEMQEISDAAARQAADEAADAVLNDLKTQLLDGEEVSAVLRNLFTEDIVVASAGQYHFFPILENLAKHNYDSSRFILDENEILSYQDADGNILSQKGIDVSRYQNTIDWSKVAGDDVDFAFIRLGIRGSEEGTLVLDPQYERNMEEAQANGIHTGVYFFTQAITEEEAVEEAEFVLEHLEPYDITYPVVFDVEAIETNDPRTRHLTREEWTNVTIAFCERIKEAGYTPMIYGNLISFMLMLDMERLEAYEKWFAFFRTPIYFPYAHGIWQYSSTGRVDGIEGDVDLNIGMVDYAKVEQDE